MNLMTGTVLAIDDINIGPSAGSDFVNLTEFTVANLISWAVTFVLIIAAVIFFFMLVIGGIKWITSGGDKAQTEGARGQITAALIGLVIVFSAWAIIILVGEFFGINLLNFSISNIADS